MLDLFHSLSQQQDSEIEIALLVGHVACGSPIAESETLDILAQRCAAQSSSSSLADRLRGAGFEPRLPSVPDLEHSDISQVARSGQGIPISLSLVVIACARQAGLSAQGVNHPGYFLVQVGDDLIDPGTLTAIDPDKQPAKPWPYASSRDIGLRMLNNLKQIYARKGAIDASLELLDCQLAMARGQREIQAALYFEQGEFWRSIAGFDAARAAFLKCSEYAQDATLRTRALQRLEDLQGRRQTLH